MNMFTLWETLCFNRERERSWWHAHLRLPYRLFKVTPFFRIRVIAEFDTLHVLVLVENGVAYAWSSSIRTHDCMNRKSPLRGRRRRRGQFTRGEHAHDEQKDTWLFRGRRHFDVKKGKKKKGKRGLVIVVLYYLLLSVLRTCVGGKCRLPAWDKKNIASDDCLA